MNKVTTNKSELSLIVNYLNNNGISIDTIETVTENGCTKTGEIELTNLGCFAPMIKDATVNIVWTTELINDIRVTLLALEYSYNHPDGGSNGKNIRLYSVDGKDFTINL